MKAICIITARGGSKRIPKKNIKNFCGKPIIAYSIEAALKSDLFDEVMVSTDSKEIAEVARKYGAKVPFMRSAKNSDDYACTDDVLKEVVNEYEKIGKCFDLICCIYPTAPLVTSEKLVDAFRLFREVDGEALETVVQYSYPPQRSYVLEDGFLKYNFPECKKMRSQDLKNVYHDAGQFYFWNVEAFRLMSEGKEVRTVPYILSEIEVQDIDGYTDWQLAELKYKIVRGLA